MFVERYPKLSLKDSPGGLVSGDWLLTCQVHHHHQEVDVPAQNPAEGADIEKVASMQALLADNF